LNKKNSKNNNKMTITRNTKEDLLRSYIEIYKAIYDKEVKPLRAREVEFLINCILLRAQGIDLVDIKATEVIKERMNLSSTNDVHVYRNKLKKKDWLIQTTDSIILPVIFDRFKNNIPKKVTFRFDLKWEDS